MDRKIRWGLMGAGKIVDRWIKGVMQVDGMEIAAVASRNIETARKTAKAYGIESALTYEEMALREDIDIVYIPVPHMAHKELAILAMEHGKAVLVEKPAAVSSQELSEMISCAKKNQVFFMEAVWTRFFPIVDKLKALFNEEGIGQVRAVNVAFSFRVPSTELDGRLLNPALAGGGLLDVGVYTLNFSDMIFDREPEELVGFAAIDTDEHHIKVDEQAMMLAKYSGGALASMACGVRTNMVDTAVVYGTKGYVELPVFWKPTVMHIHRNGGIEEYYEKVQLKNSDYEDEGFQYEIAHVNECLRAGLLESKVMTWEKSLRILKQCDELRGLWGLKYPFE
jgi:predicted dehydrogenase